MLSNDAQGDRRDFGPAVRFLVAEAYYSEQVVVPFLVLDQERQAFVGGRVLLRRTGCIDIDMAA